MTLQFFILAASIFLLMLGAEGLVRGSVSVAFKMGLTPLVVGLTVVAFGTSAPELVVSLQATLTGRGEIAVGNIVGSNIFNIAVILALTALICPIRIALPVLRLDAPIMVVVTVLVAAILSRGVVSSPVGFALVLALVSYTGFTIWMAKKNPFPAVEAEFEAGTSARLAACWQDAGFLIGGLALLILGSDLLVDSASVIARGFGVSEAIIALTVVAAGTSMPELATSVLAAFRRQPDIAIGNVVGSNLFNLLGILGAAAVTRPIAAPGISAVDLGAMTIFALALLPLMWTNRTLQRWEGGILIAGYAAYLAWLWPT